MNITYLNFLPNFGFDNTIYYLNPEGKFYGWDKNSGRFYNLSTPDLNDVQGISFDNLQEGDVLSYDSVSQTWINKVISTSTGVNSFNERQGDVYLLGSDITYALEYTPENTSNKTSTIFGNETSETYFPTIKGLVDWVNSLFITINAAFNWYIKGDASWSIKELETENTFFKVNANGNVLIGTDIEDPSAILNLNSTSKGFLPPRMTAEERNLINSPAIGLTVYQINEEEGLYINKSSGWVFIG